MIPSGEVFGHIGATAVHAVTIENRNGLYARLITFGARLTELWVPDRMGKPGDVVLGFDTLNDYLATDHYFGATCGRYGNRIANGQFRLGSREFQLDQNEGRNHLHGGKAGFDCKVWTIAELAPARVVFVAVSHDGEMGYPGTCQLRSTYELTDDNRLLITMEAVSDADTLMNMVHHSYFNLAGHGSGDVCGHIMQLNSPFYTPVDHELLATGEVLAVAGTPFDFRTPKSVGQDIDALPVVAVGDLVGGGYDHNWCLGDAGVAMRDVVDLSDPVSGRRMRLRSTEPGVQIYTGGYLTDRVMAKRGSRMCRFAGLTFETQKFPGAPNHPHFPAATLRADEPYCHVMEFAFTTDAPG
jgi:aldose 1-epimerase